MTANLATALAQFQGSGYAIPRLRTVTVESRKTGTSYTFDYAPHELIVAAIRKPLADNGLSVSQPLATTPEGRPGLRTVLMHTSGESIESVFPLPISDGMTAQELGSAITYIRRYALSAILGLATEDDDDGNRASGNTVKDRKDRPSTTAQEPRNPDGGLIGVAEVAKAPWDTEIRMTPDGPSFGFGLKEGRQIVRVTATGDLAQSLELVWPEIVGKRVECFGAVTPDEWIIGKGSANERKVPYFRLALERIATPDLILPAPVTDSPIDDEIAQLPILQDDAA
jgi:hypothetical protein